MTREAPISPEEFLGQLISPAELLRKAAELGVTQRRRKLSVLDLFQAVVLAADRPDGQSLAGIRRFLRLSSGIGVARSAFWSRLSEKFEQLMEYALRQVESKATKQRPSFSGVLAPFRDVVALDSTVVHVADDLAQLWPASRWQMQAGLKVHTEIRCTTGELLEHQLTAETTHDIHFVNEKRWQAGVLYLADLAYSRVSLWTEIAAQQAFFVARLHSNLQPRLLTTHNRTIGRRHVGKPLRTIIRKRTGDIDAQCLFNVRNTTNYAVIGEAPFRVVGLWNKKRSCYHLYVTNIPPEQASTKAIAELYRLRWEVEIFYKVAKGGFGLTEFTTKTPHIIRTMIYAALLRCAAAMCSLSVARGRLPTDKNISPVAWCRVWRQLHAPLALNLMRHSRRPIDWLSLAKLAAEPNVHRLPTRTACQSINLSEPSLWAA